MKLMVAQSITVARYFQCFYG